MLSEIFLSMSFCLFVEVFFFSGGRDYRWDWVQTMGMTNFVLLSAQSYDTETTQNYSPF